MSTSQPPLKRRILLEDYRIAVSIGIYDFERQAPQTVIVNVELELADDWRDPEDRIERALNYDILHHGIAALVKDRHFNLQETLCRDILQFCLAQPGLKRVRVSTRKPDIYPDCKSIGFEIEAAVPGGPR